HNFGHGKQHLASVLVTLDLLAFALMNYGTQPRKNSGPTVHSLTTWRRSVSTGAEPEPAMKLRPSVASVISEHVVFELESIERLYLNVYVPRLQREGGAAAFLRFHRGHLTFPHGVRSSSSESAYSG